MEIPSPIQKQTRGKSALLGVLSGISVALAIGVVVGVYSVPHIQVAVRGLNGAVFGSLIIGTVSGPIGGLLARRRHKSPFIGGAMLTGVVAIVGVAYLVMAYGGGDWPG